MTSLCVVETCRDPRCTDACEQPCDRAEHPPQVAAPGLVVCDHDADRPRWWLKGKPADDGWPRTGRPGITALPELYDQLAERSVGGDRTSSGGDERPVALADERRQARHAIRAMLVSWALLLADERRAKLPADDIPALCEHLDRNLGWLLAKPEHADQLVHDVGFAHRWAAALTNTGRTGIRLLCSCGERVLIDTEPAAIMTCPGCGEWGDLKWWQQREAPVTEGPLTLSQLPDWLFANRALVVTSERLRTWRARGLLAAAAVAAACACDLRETPEALGPHPAGCWLWRPQGAGRPAFRYDPVAVAVVVEHRLRVRMAS